MLGVLKHLEQSSYVTVTLTHGTGLDGFYEQLGFQAVGDATRVWKRGDTNIDAPTKRWTSER